MKKLVSTLFITAGALMLASASASAQIVLAIDINSNNRSFANTADMSPTYLAGGFTGWNLINQDTTAPLTTATFGDYTVSLGVVAAATGSRDRLALSGPVGDVSDLYRDLSQITATTAADSVTLPTGSAAITLKVAGLTANSNYTLQLWSFDYNSNANLVSRFWDMNNGSGSLLGIVTNTPNNVMPTDLSSYTISGTVHTNASGEIILGTTSSGSRSFINGFTVTAVPEPSTYALCAALGVFAVVVIKRRRNV